jgi:glycosyltransferase involved in cell wall biosynthesis
MSSIDVLIPCYQYGRYLRSSVTSVLGQDVSNLRILILDNGSTDNSVEVAQQLASEDQRIEVVARRTNLGPQASFNEGIDWAEADYYMQLDADDLLAPGALRRAMLVMDQNPNLTFTYGSQALLYPDGSVYLGGISCFLPREDRARASDGLAAVLLELDDSQFMAGKDAIAAMRRQSDHSARDELARMDGWTVWSGQDFIAHHCRVPVNMVGAPTVVRRTSAQKKAGYYCAKLPYYDDMEMSLRLATLGDVAQSAAVQGFRRIHATSHGRWFTSVILRDFQERDAVFDVVFDGAKSRGPRAIALHRQATRSLAAHAYWSAVSHLVRGK